MNKVFVGYDILQKCRNLFQLQLLPFDPKNLSWWKFLYFGLRKQVL